MKNEKFINKTKNLLFASSLAVALSIFLPTYSSTQTNNNKSPKDATLFEKGIVNGSAAYHYLKNPEFFGYVTYHEGVHALTSLVLNQGVKEFSLFPLVYSDKYIKEHEFNGDSLSIYNSNKDFSKEAFTANTVASGLRLVGIGQFGRVVLDKKFNEMGRLEKAAIFIAPYITDIILINSFKNKIRKSLYDENNNIYFNLVSAQMGTTLLNSGLSIVGGGDTYNIADGILPADKFNGLEYEIARRLIGLAIGAGIVYTEYKIINPKH